MVENLSENSKSRRMEKMNNLSPGGLYIHIPFCKSKCRYCDFYSFSGRENEREAYTARMEEALLYYRERMERRYNSLYFGGGTPLFLGEERLERLLLGAKPDLTEGAEITVEGNPVLGGSFDFGRLYRAGANRLSFGLQSADERELKALGRLHSASDAADTVKAAQKAGFSDISLDLMLGIPYQTKESLAESIGFCASLGVTHLSAYLLKIEENTPLAKSDLRFLCADDEKASELYLFACEELERLGYRQYEISNFARDGHKSRHNLKYWNQEEYLGIGPSAHSFLGNRRFYFDRNFRDFLEKPFEELEREEGLGGDWEEYAMLRLRLTEGLDLRALSERFPEAPVSSIKSRAALYEKAGLTVVSENAVRLTPKGFLLSSPLTAEILYE